MAYGREELSLVLYDLFALNAGLIPKPQLAE